MQDVEHPQVRVIGGDVSGSVQEVLHSTVQSWVIKKLALGKREPIISYKHYCVVQEHINQLRTQFLSGLIASREELLIVT